MDDMQGLKAEDRLNYSFANLVLTSPEFRLWLLRKTKFSKVAPRSEPIPENEYLVRYRRFWWRHWWSYVPIGSDQQASGEIDIFVVFQVSLARRRHRFALLIENKLAHSNFTKYQLLGSYRHVGTRRLNDSEWLNYDDFESVIISPINFYNRYQSHCDGLFDRFIAHEEIAQFLPEFTSGQSTFVTN